MPFKKRGGPLYSSEALYEERRPPEQTRGSLGKQESPVQIGDPIRRKEALFADRRLSKKREGPFCADRRPSRRRGGRGPWR